MVDVYIYVPQSLADDIVECGMKLSEYRDRAIYVNDVKYPCIKGYLHPADFAETEDNAAVTASRQEKPVCIRAEVRERYCFICDGDLFELARRDYNYERRYLDSIVPIEKYVMGSYRRPECLVTCTLVGDSLFRIEAEGGETLIYESSEQLYYEYLESLLIDVCGLDKKTIMSGLFFYLKEHGYLVSENIDDSRHIFYGDEMKRIFYFDEVNIEKTLRLLNNN